MRLENLVFHSHQIIMVILVGINKNFKSKEILNKVSSLKIGEVSPANKKANSVVFLKMVDKKKSQIEIYKIRKTKI